jgi:enamine deaminase RidA (YjgF/YER057c/UK114 family)
MSLRTTLFISTLGAAALLAGCATNASQSPELIRYKIPTQLPHLQRGGSAAGASTIYLSGKVPPWWTRARPPTTRQLTADTEGQTVNVLKSIDAQLKAWA